MRVTHESNGVMLSARKSSAVDFSQVPEHQREIDGRLLNWAKSIRDGYAKNISPMFRLMPKVVRSEPGAPSVVGADHADAAVIAKAVAHLPEKHRHALVWCYVKPGAPSLAARQLAVTVRGLGDLVNDGRQMLINRGV